MTNDNFSQSDIDGIKTPNKKARSNQWLVFLFIGLIVLIGIGVAIKISSDKKAAEQKAALEQKYADDLNAATVKMLAGGTIAEKMISAYSSVWLKTIETDLSEKALASALEINETDLEKYFEPVFEYENPRVVTYVFENPRVVTYVFKGNFNDAIGLVNHYYSVTNQNATLELQKTDMAQTMKSLNTPPEKYKDSYQLALDMYLAWDEIISLAISPTGSYTSYSQQTEELLSNFVLNYKEFNIKMAQ